MAYDEKLRRRVMQYKNSGHTFDLVYEAFGISLRSYYVWKSEFEEEGKRRIIISKVAEGK
ncbi:MAG: helix-turn-helix domain containing protein [Treponema sp.]|jgi:transposase|nr:helix-turn-helix domain containing protein [Treponema sp.]